ncbi:unnamed protein product [Sphenostylis stenocarpa]|uniref:Uncharacterized protein n=1 Tax=Sphenostylis stenocarpa TaxID=92480 RepID=A0AA86SBV1_9FABA|nr:unnamed protein product [Sphenostylis stenocarpa]
MKRKDKVKERDKNLREKGKMNTWIMPVIAENGNCRRPLNTSHMTRHPNLLKKGTRFVVNGCFLSQDVSELRWVQGSNREL